MSISNPQDVHTHPELKRKLYSALAEGDEGELSISIPEGTVRPSGQSVAGFASESAYYFRRLENKSDVNVIRR
jgi:transcription initiation factor TFIID subunit 2